MKTNETTKTTTDATTEAKTFDQKMWEARNARRDSRRDEFVEADAIMELALKAQRIKSPLQAKFGCDMIATARDAARSINEMIDDLEKIQVAVLSAGTMHDTTRVPEYIRDINDVVRNVAKLKSLADTLRAAESFEQEV